jgi:8-oxo-dGTP pyrophosphatase MutT (NUDIX family)
VEQRADLAAVLDAYRPRSEDGRQDLERMRALVAGSHPWDRSSLLHATGSAIIVHPDSRRVLLRWHERQQGWLQVGGHADPGETSPFRVAMREAQEETGLTDLQSWPESARPLLLQVVIVPVPAGRGEPSHEHADLRYLLASSSPRTAAPESNAARIRWLALEEAMAETSEDNLRECLRRVAELLSLRSAAH